MQIDFHYYAAYAASVIAGFSHEEALRIAYSDQFTDCCTRRFLSKIGGPKNAATTQTQIELADARTDLIGLQDITRIWSSFHFLPYDLYAKVKAGIRYRNKYRLICMPNGSLVKDTVENAKGKGPEAAGVAMHVLCDTWAHSGFAGTPSLVINNTNDYFYEILPDPSGIKERKIKLTSSLGAVDDPETGAYNGSLYQPSENSIMNLGHGRAGHLPDYSYAQYKYLPAWMGYEERYKDNQHDYFYAFCQMTEALKYLHGDIPEFDVEKYAFKDVEPYKDEIMAIISKRQILASEDWKRFGEKLSGKEIPDFDATVYDEEYINASKDRKSETVHGKFITAALSQKSLVSYRVYESKNLLAGIVKAK